MKQLASSQLGLRFISAVFLSALVLVVALLGYQALLLFALIVAIGLQYELNQIVTKIPFLKDHFGDKFWLLTAIVTILSILLDHSLVLVCLTFVALPTISLLRLLTTRASAAHQKELIVQSVLSQWFFLCYGLLLPSICISIIKLPKGSIWFFLLLFVALGADILAFFIGKKWGKRLLAPTISPAKTREGALGSLIGSIIFGLIALILFLPDLPTGKTLLISFGAGPLTIVGDLWESLLKRLAEVKDSGRLIPGHGGILDRIDSILWVAPWVYFVILVF